MVFSQLGLKIALKLSDLLVYGLSGGGEVVRTVYTLLVKVNMNVWQPLIVQLQSGFALCLCRPHPVAIKIKDIVIGSSRMPRFEVLGAVGIRLWLYIFYLVIPVDIAFASVGINAGINNN